MEFYGSASTVENDNFSTTLFDDTQSTTHSFPMTTFEVFTTISSSTLNQTFFPKSCAVPLPDPYHNVIFSTFIYAMYAAIFIIALLGNTFVCYIVIHSPRMKTVTNYFIMNLSIGDLLITLICVPFTSVTLMKQHWIFGDIMCPIVCYVSALSVFISTYTLVAISLDKYMLIVYPLKPRMSKRYATWIIMIIWIFAGITVLPSGIFSEVFQPYDSENDYDYSQCDKYVCRDYFNYTYTTVLTILQYVIPLIVLLFTYTTIGAIIWCHKIPGEAENLRDKRMARHKRKMIKMMITVVFVFTCCWLPYNVYFMCDHYIPPNQKPLIYVLLHCLAMSHTCYNPIIYCYMNTRFRDGLILILKVLPCAANYFSHKSSHKGSMSSTHFQRHAGLEGSDSISLQRNNTCTTYVTINKKNRFSLQQTPTRSISQMRNSSNHTSPANNGTTLNGSRNKGISKELVEESM